MMYRDRNVAIGQRHFAIMPKHAKVQNSHAHHAPQYPQTANIAANQKPNISLIFPKREYPLIALLKEEVSPASSPFSSSLHEALNLKAPIPLSLVLHVKS
jgi:hypothetical protein